MNTRVLEVFQRHFVAGSHIHIRHRRRESLPSQVLISQKVLRNFFGRERRCGCMDCGRDLLRRSILGLWIKSEDLHWRLLIRDGRRRFDVLRLDLPSPLLTIYSFFFRLWEDEIGIWLPRLWPPCLCSISSSSFLKGKTSISKIIKIIIINNN